MGRIAAPFRVQGWVRIKPFTADPAGLDEYAQWIVRVPEGWIGLPLEDFELHSKGPVAKRAGCDDRDAAPAVLLIRYAPPAEPGHFPAAESPPAPDARQPSAAGRVGPATLARRDTGRAAGTGSSTSPGPGPGWGRAARVRSQNGR